MYRILAWLLALLLAIPAAAEGVSAFDLDGMTVEELTALHSAVTQRIAIVNGTNVVYNEDGIVIVWNKLLDTKSSSFRMGCTVFNHLGKDCRFEISAGGVNGIQMGPGANTGRRDLPDGMGVYTGSFHSWLFHNAFRDLGIEHVNEIYLQVTIYDKDTGKELREIELRFPVDIAL